MSAERVTTYSAYICGRCTLPILEVPHTDEENGDDLHDACCAFCHPELMTPEQRAADLPTAAVVRRQMRDRSTSSCLDPEAPIPGHGALTRDQAARAS